MNWKKWIKAAAVRAVKTIAQAAVASIGAAVVISEVDWKYIVSASLISWNTFSPDKSRRLAGGRYGGKSMTDKDIIIEEGVETTQETLDEITNGKGDDE